MDLPHRIAAGVIILRDEARVVPEGAASGRDRVPVAGHGTRLARVRAGRLAGALPAHAEDGLLNGPRPEQDWGQSAARPWGGTGSGGWLS